MTTGKSIRGFSRLTGYSKSLVQRLVWAGKIEMDGKVIPDDVVARVMEEKAKYISLYEYACGHTTDKFRGKMASDRTQLKDYLEISDYFGVERIRYDKILMGTEQDLCYFKRSDIPHLEACLGDFFKGFGVAEKDKIDRLLKDSKDSHPVSCDLLDRYFFVAFPERPNTPACTQFVKAILDMPDVPQIRHKDFNKALKGSLSGTAKEYLVKYLNYCRERIDVNYGEVSLKQPPRKSVTAYSDMQYISIMHCVFNSDYIDKHKMIEKALDKPVWGETWLYISLYATCSWRAADVCRGWKYPGLYKDGVVIPGIDKNTLREDILHDRIPDETYEAVCRYCISGVDTSQRLPSKTADHNPYPLRVAITPELYTFFGLLTLIAEANMMTYGKGYMQDNKASEYQNKVNLKGFFGPEILIPLHGHNLQSRRLNKSYLQGIEKNARANGNDGLMASMVASYARNHTSLDTIKYYLQDHAWSGETAEMVIYYMMQRGVFGFLYYQTLLAAYPEVMQSLPMQQQNDLIAMMDVSPMDLELYEKDVLEATRTQEDFLSGNTDMVKRTLKAMLEISQDRGKAKDTGVYCLKRALKEACVHPEHGSCLANGCKYQVFTREGIIPLIQILKQYRDASVADLKARAVLAQVLLPRYKEVVNAVMREAGMAADDRKGIKQIMEDILDE